MNYTVYKNIIIVINVFTSIAALAQGSSTTTISARIVDAPTRIGTVDGPLAGPEILAKLYAGLESDSLQPVGFISFHRLDVDGNPSGKLLMGGPIEFVPIDERGYAQIRVWDSTVWGMDFSKVPENQFGLTEIQQFPAFREVGGGGPNVNFQQAAIVPAIPEPKTCVLLLFGSLLLIHGLSAKYRTANSLRYKKS